MCRCGSRSCSGCSRSRRRAARPDRSARARALDGRAAPSGGGRSRRAPPSRRRSCPWCPCSSSDAPAAGAPRVPRGPLPFSVATQICAAKADAEHLRSTVGRWLRTSTSGSGCVRRACGRASACAASRRPSASRPASSPRWRPARPSRRSRRCTRSSPSSAYRSTTSWVMSRERGIRPRRRRHRPAVPACGAAVRPEPDPRDGERRAVGRPRDRGRRACGCVPRHLPAAASSSIEGKLMRHAGSSTATSWRARSPCSSSSTRTCCGPATRCTSTPCDRTSTSTRAMFPRAEYGSSSGVVEQRPAADPSAAAAPLNSAVDVLRAMDDIRSEA